MTQSEANRLEYLENVEFPTPAEFEELRSLLAKQTDEHIKEMKG